MSAPGLAGHDRRTGKWHVQESGLGVDDCRDGVDRRHGRCGDAGLVASFGAWSRLRPRVMLGLPSMRNTMPPWPGCAGRGQLSGHGVEVTAAKY